MFVIGSDTIVSDRTKIFEKPRSRDEAVQFLRAFRNSSHFVYSAVCMQTNCRLSAEVLDEARTVLSSDPFVSNVYIESGDSSVQFHFVSVCEVVFGDISDTEIDWYVQTSEPYDKAGGYGIQQTAARWVQGVRGDYNCVVGLPAGALFRLLRAVGAVA